VGYAGFVCRAYRDRAPPFRRVRGASKVIGWRAESMLVKGRHALSEFGGGCGAMLKRTHTRTQMECEKPRSECIFDWIPQFPSPIIESQKGVGRVSE
jgi:hypothetical protein